MTSDEPLDPDRLFPVEGRTRAIARELYALVDEAPIVSPHGHVPARLLLDDAPFPDPSTLLVSADHYVTRLLHAAGVELAALRENPDPREVWRLFCDHWHWFHGTAVGFWMRETLSTVLGVNGAPRATMYDTLVAALAQPGIRPRALFDAFRIDVLATTDDPLDDLAAHQALRADPSFRGRVLPTFRPDAYLDPSMPGWGDRVERLGATSYATYLDALRERRAYFIAHGAVSADHGVAHAAAIDIDDRDAAALFERARSGDLDASEAAIFSAHMLLASAEMSVDDGLVMTVHAGVQRNHHTATFDRFGGDTGHDIPLATSFTQPLRPLLERFGTTPGFHLVLFAIDESVWSREIAPLAGFYPSVFIGAPWWFLDAPDASRRFREATVETAGFYRGSGFIDDTRAFLSVPARHTMARRIDSGFLAQRVVEGRLTMSEASRVATDLVGAIPRAAFKL
ncbi:glucuronate isomerase [Yonghaparkia sp. Soil809]|uniref:glucuronate isomerase n=1 Tax=Yonghaparkia sp. Soil809 TaxID=1736417 RepID=UPI0006FE9398|nr:glucuronate isomerase [Yonghaparkia sp. Soil809]KRF32853.1 glucuronate isomerase [Yonghaparkia sp. Soil809]